MKAALAGAIRLSSIWQTQNRKPLRRPSSIPSARTVAKRTPEDWARFGGGLLAGEIIGAVQAPATPESGHHPVVLPPAPGA
jgi:hypothetical protein